MRASLLLRMCGKVAQSASCVPSASVAAPSASQPFTYPQAFAVVAVVGGLFTINLYNTYAQLSSYTSELQMQFRAHAAELQATRAEVGAELVAQTAKATKLVEKVEVLGEEVTGVKGLAQD